MFRIITLSLIVSLLVAPAYPVLAQSQPTDGSNSSQYYYDHDNARVKLAEKATTTIYPDDNYELKSSQVKLSIYAGDI